MAITKSAKKALRQSLRKRTRNSKKKVEMKKLLKEFNVFVSQKKIDEAKKILPKIYKTLDKAAKIGLIKKNAAARKKSRITKSISRVP